MGALEYLWGIPKAVVPYLGHPCLYKAASGVKFTAPINHGDPRKRGRGPVPRTTAFPRAARTPSGRTWRVHGLFWRTGIR